MAEFLVKIFIITSLLQPWWKGNKWSGSIGRTAFSPGALEGSPAKNIYISHSMYRIYMKTFTVILIYHYNLITAMIILRKSNWFLTLNNGTLRMKFLMKNILWIKIEHEHTLHQTNMRLFTNKLYIDQEGLNIIAFKE